MPFNIVTKNIGKFPKKVAHASFLQCLAYIIFGQNDCLKKINLKILCNRRVRRIRKSMVNMAVSCSSPQTFFLGSDNY